MVTARSGGGGASRPDEVWRVTTSAGHQLHAVEWRATQDTAGQPDVLLVHGLASNARLWDDVATGLAARGHRVVAYDQRGHGQSDRAEDGYPWAGVLRDLGDVVDALDLDRPVAVGQSWGGNVVVEAAARASSHVRGVVAIDGGFIDLQATFDDVDAAWLALTPPPLSGVSYGDVVTRMTDRFADWPPNALRGQLANFTRTSDGSAAPALRREDHELIVRQLWRQRPVESAAAATVPVLVAPCRRGDDDRRVAAVDRLVAALPRGRVHWFEGADHDVHAQRPHEVVAVIGDAFADGSSGSTW